MKIKANKTIESKAKRVNNDGKIEDKTTFFYYAFRNILLVGLPLIIASSFALSHSFSHVSADNSAVDNVAITVPTSCTLEGTLNSAHTASLIAGTYTADIGTTTLKAYCNDANGFTIYAVGNGNNTTGNTALISGIGEDYNIPTGLNTSRPLEGNDISNWSMKLTALDGTYKPTITNNYDNYNLIPSTYTNVAYFPASTDVPNNATTTVGSSITTTYAVYLSSAQPAGTYTGQVKYAILHPHTSGDVVTLDLAYKRANKTRLILKTDGTTIPENDPTAENIPTSDIMGSYYTMQDMTTTICNNANITGEASQTQLLDIRDKKIYWATKLDDGHCWMTQNLDLDLIADTTASNYVALTSENTDLNLYDSMGYDSSNGYSCSNSSTTTDCTANNETISWVPERSTITPGNLNSNTWVNDVDDPYSYDNGSVYPDNDVTASNSGSHGLSGNYYNWTASMASNNSGSYVSGLVSARNSICPKGWRLPNATDEDLVGLLVSYGVIKNSSPNTYLPNGFQKIISAPLYFIRSGIIHYSAPRLSSVGQSGYYHYSTVHRYGAYGLQFGSNNIRPTIVGSNNDDNKGNGRSLRCLAR